MDINTFLLLLAWGKRIINLLVIKYIEIIFNLIASEMKEYVAKEYRKII